MLNGYGISLSGLLAATTRMATSASNIANAQSTTSFQDELANTPYQPEDTVLDASDTGGVNAKVVNRDPASVPVYDPSSPVAAADGVVNYPNVDIADELVNEDMASYDFKANLVAMRTQQQATKSLYDFFA